MLGKNFEVVIDGSAYGENAKYCPPLYIAHIVDPLNRMYNKKVYVISNKQLQKYLTGTVIAIANKGMGQREKLILAPQDTIYYSPEIRSRLSRIKNQGHYKLSCLYEKSCGAVIFHESNGEYYFLLVKNKNGLHWGFPKGHIEVGETEEQTALREIKEETDLDVVILDGFRKTSVYRLFGRVKKKVVIFLAQSNSKNVKIQNSEIETYKWVKKEAAYTILRYRNDLKIFEAALGWLNSKISCKM